MEREQSFEQHQLGEQQERGRATGTLYAYGAASSEQRTIRVARKA
jgi:hypothetical protein